METLNSVLGFANNLTNRLFTLLFRPLFGNRAKTHPGEIWTIPNLLSAIRAILGPAIWVIAAEKPRTALILFAFGLLSDRIDGVIARITGVTKSGEIVDPSCDKVFFFFCALAYIRSFSTWLVSLVLAIELLLLVAPPIILKFRGIKMSEVDLRSTNHGKTKFGLECVGLAIVMLGWSPRIGDLFLAAAIPLAILSITDKLKAVLGTADE